MLKVFYIFEIQWESKNPVIFSQQGCHPPADVQFNEFSRSTAHITLFSSNKINRQELQLERERDLFEKMQQLLIFQKINI